MKRNATSDLNHDNWNEEDTPEDAGLFQKAAPDIIERRSIKLARRRLPPGSSSAGGSSVFSSFQGFSSMPQSTSPFSFLKPGNSSGNNDDNKNASVSSNQFAFLKKDQPSENISAATIGDTGSGKQLNFAKQDNPSGNTSDFKKEDVSDGNKPFSFSKEDDKSCKRVENSESELTSVPISEQNPLSPSAPYTTAYMAALADLNKCFVDCINMNMEKNNLIIFAPCFRDYEKHLKNILVFNDPNSSSEDRGDGKKGADKDERTGKPSGGADFNFGKSLKNQEAPKPNFATSSSLKEGNPKITFGTGSLSNQETSKVNFGTGSSTKQETPKINFDMGSSTKQETPKINFGIGSSTKKETPKINFGSAKEESQKFNFGAGASTVSAKIKFNFGPGSSEATKINFGTGSSVNQETSKFNFGIGSSTSQETQKFTFGTSSPTNPEKPKISFGTSDNQEKPKISFGASGNQEIPKITFGTSDNKEKPNIAFGTSDNQEKSKITFGSPDNQEKSKISFGSPDNQEKSKISFGSPDNQEKSKISFGSPDNQEKSKISFGSPENQEKQKISFGTGSPTSAFSFGTTNQGTFGASTTKTSSLFAGSPTFSAATPSPGFWKPPTTSAAESKEGSASKTDNAEDEDAPPKVEFKPVVEEGSVYDKRCKVFVKKGTAYQDRGVGTLFLKPVSPGGKTQLIVRADTSLGNVLINTILIADLSTQKMGNNNVIIICVPNERETEPVPVLLKVKTSEDADELLSKLNEYKK